MMNEISLDNILDIAFIRSDSINNSNNSIDVESQITENNQKSDNNSQLKSILKKESQFDKEYHELLRDEVLKIIIIIMAILFIIPFVGFDLYFAINDNSCVNIYPNNLNINIKLYLLVSGLSSITGIIILIISLIYLIYKIIKKNITFYYITSNIINIVALLYTLIWNIIGAILFWGIIYPSGKCNSDIATYLFISLVIKLTIVISNLVIKNQR